jgi:integrase
VKNDRNRLSESVKVPQRGVFERPPGSGIWWVRYVDADGILHRERVGPKGLALRVYQKRKTEIRERKFFPQSLARSRGRTFAEALDEYVGNKESSWKAWKEWKRIAAKWKQRFNGRYLNALTREDIERELLKLQRTVKPGTANRHLTLLKAFFNHALAHGACDRNPAQFVKKLRENNERVRHLSEAEEERLMAALPDKYRPVLRFAILTGMRRGEIFGLRWSHIDFSSRVIAITEPKEGKIKRLPISEAVCHLLQWQNGRAREPAKIDDRPYPYDAHNFVNRVFIPAVRRAENTGLSLPRLAPYVRVRLAMMGVDLTTIGRLMGHHGVRMTERYAHLTEARLRAAVELLTDTTTFEEEKSEWAVQVSNLRPPACKTELTHFG